jgi:hypothetical protein
MAQMKVTCAAARLRASFVFAFSALRCVSGVLAEIT